MKLYRCNQCDGHEFQADKPVCPKCKVDGDDPRAKSRGVIDNLVVIHFDAPSEIVGAGVGSAACDASLKVGRVIATGVAPVVNCPHCKLTEAYKKAMTQFDPKYDVPTTIQPNG